MSNRARLVLVVAVAACGGDPSTPKDAAPTDDFDRSAMLAHLATNVFTPWHAEFASAAAALPPAIAAHCDALDAGQGATTVDAMRTAFARAIDAWQRPEAVLVGPAAMDMKTLRGLVYGWPNLSACEIDRDVASRWADPSSYDVTREFVSTRSLAAIEFLLYPPTDNHSCLGPPAGWTELGANLPRARCRLAHVIAVDVAAQGATLADAWTASYADELANAGKGSSIPSAQLGINLVSDGIFFVDKMVKDMKLGEAAGIAVNVCDAVGAPCDREVELRFSDRSSFAIRANLEATRTVFTGEVPGGATGPGFDDFLIAVGHSDVAQRMTAALDDAIAKANALPDSFLTALTTRYSDVAALHAATKLFTDDLKSQFLTLLSLEIPDDVAADND